MLIFFDEGVSEPYCTVWFPIKKPMGDEDDYLLPNKEGRKLRNFDELVANVRKRVERSRAESRDRSPKVSRAGFERWPSDSELDTSDLYYYVRVPPDEEFRPELEERAQKKDLEAASALYKYYTERSQQQRESDQQRDLLHAMQEARTLHANGARCFKYRSVVTYPDERLLRMSPDGNFVVVLQEGCLRLFGSGGETPLYEATHVYNRSSHNPIPAVIFSPDGNCLAYLSANGNTSIIDLTTRKRQALCKLGWPTATNTYLSQFTFSPDSRYLALNLEHGEAGMGSAIVVWKTASGEQTLVKSKKWELKKDFCLVGFGSKPGSIRLADSTYWKYLNTLEAVEAKSEWKIPNDDIHLQQTIPTVEVLKIPGVNVETSAKPQ